jgi:hypothetical protein
VRGSIGRLRRRNFVSCSGQSQIGGLPIGVKLEGRVRIPSAILDGRGIELRSRGPSRSIGRGSSNRAVSKSVLLRGPRVRIHLPPAASLQIIGPSPEEDAKIAQEHPAKLSAAAVRPGRRRPLSVRRRPLARTTRKGRQTLCRMIQSASCRRCRSEARRILSRADLQLQRCNRKETPWTTRCRKRRQEPGAADRP